MFRKLHIVFIGIVLMIVPGCGKGKKSAEHEVQITVTENGFEPARTTIPRGEPLTLVVERKTDQACAKQIVLEGLAIKTQLPLNQPIRIQLPADVIGDSLGFACGADKHTGMLVAK